MDPIPCSYESDLVGHTKHTCTYLCVVFFIFKQLYIVLTHRRLKHNMRRFLQMKYLRPPTAFKKKKASAIKVQTHGRIQSVVQGREMPELTFFLMQHNTEHLSRFCGVNQYQSQSRSVCMQTFSQGSCWIYVKDNLIIPNTLIEGRRLWTLNGSLQSVLLERTTFEVWGFPLWTFGWF